jgi:hypothetical protein
LTQIAKYRLWARTRHLTVSIMNAGQVDDAPHLSGILCRMTKTRPRPFPSRCDIQPGIVLRAQEVAVVRHVVITGVNPDRLALAAEVADVVQVNVAMQRSWRG